MNENPKPPPAFRLRIQAGKWHPWPAIAEGASESELTGVFVDKVRAQLGSGETITLPAGQHPDHSRAKRSAWAMAFRATQDDADCSGATNGGRAMRADSFLCVREVAEKLGITADQVRALIGAGVLQAVNVALPGKKKPRWRIRADDLETFIAARTARPPAKLTRQCKVTTAYTEYF
jgi:excisionase family DNA binding protein